MHGNHLKQMLLAAGGVFVVLLVAGVPLGKALPYTFALACPLMMVLMMRSGGHGQHGGHDHAHGEQPQPPQGIEHRDAGDVESSSPR